MSLNNFDGHFKGLMICIINNLLTQIREFQCYRNKLKENNKGSSVAQGKLKNERKKKKKSA